MTDCLLDEVRRLNVVIREDDETITAVSPCPTAAHRPEKVRSAYTVRFVCPHGEDVQVFCAPCTADRRAGAWACLDRSLRTVSSACPGSRVVEVTTLTPRTSLKSRFR